MSAIVTCTARGAFFPSNLTWRPNGVAILKQSGSLWGHISTLGSSGLQGAILKKLLVVCGAFLYLSHI
jgi:hypothetical protein